MNTTIIKLSEAKQKLQIIENLLVDLVQQLPASELADTELNILNQTINNLVKITSNIGHKLRIYQR